MGSLEQFLNAGRVAHKCPTHGKSKAQQGLSFFVTLHEKQLDVPCGWNIADRSQNRLRDPVNEKSMIATLPERKRQ